MPSSATTALLDALPDPVILLDRHRRVVAANRAAKDLLGPQITQRALALSIRHPEVLDAVTAVLGGERQKRARVTLLSSVPRTFDVQIASLPPESSDSAEVVLTMHDMTAARNAEQMRADFVANVSHELRSPLSSLVGFIETLRGAAHDDESARDRFLAIMDSEAKRMARLIEDLLSLSKVEANEHVPPEGRVEMQDLIRDVANTLSERARERGVEISLPASTERFSVAGDRDELTEVFHNLLDNSVKYCREGTHVRVSIDRISRIPDLGGAGVVVTVADEGEGIPAEHLPRLTERFYRVDKGRSRSMGGTGLGLAIVKHIVNRHRGRLTADSAVGKGSVFKVYLPEKRGNPEAP